MRISDTGSFDSKIMIVTDYPEYVDIKKEKLFESPSGLLLKNMLSSACIDITKCYCTSLVPHEVKNEYFDGMYKDKKRTDPTDELSGYRKILLEKILGIRPNIVILLGTEPLKAVLNKLSISSWRGSICKFNGIKIIPTFHPRYLFKVYSDRLLCEMDLKKAQIQSYNKEVIGINEPEMVVNPTYDITLDWIERLHKDNVTRVSFDIETTMETQVIRTLGLAYKKKDGSLKSISIPFMKNNFKSCFSISKDSNRFEIKSNNDFTSYFDPRQELVILDKLSLIFANSKIQKVGHFSIDFDQPIIEEQFRFEFKNHYMDTLHAHHLCYLELPKGLDFLCLFYTNYSNYWSDKVTGDDRSNAIYNCWDCVVTLECSYLIEKELEDMKLKDFYFDHIHPLAFALTRASNYGVRYDSAKAAFMMIEYKKKLDEINKEAKSELMLLYNDESKDINLASPTQLKELLYEKLKYPKQFSKENSITTDAEAIKKLIRKYPQDKILQIILEHREAAKIISTYLDIKLDSDGVMRTSFNASGTDTGRISSSATIRGTGSNLQNVPKDLRDLFIAREGCTIIKGDLSQAETLVVAELLAKHGDYTLVKRYDESDFDIHRWAAAAIFECKECEVTSFQRQVGKLANHSGNYGAGPGVLVSQGIKRGIPGIDFKFSQRILEARHRHLPGLRRWWKALESELKTSRTLVTALNRKRIFFGRLDEYTFRTAYAFEPQSIVGDIANRILTSLDDRLPPKCRVILQVHDEVVIECPDYNRDECIRLFQECSKIPVQICPGRKPLIIPIDLAYGKTWGTCIGIKKDGVV